MQVMTNFFDLPPPCTHMCAFSVTPPLSTIIYVQYKISFHIKKYVTVFYIQIWFKCEIFSNKNYDLLKKTLHRKNTKKLSNYMFDTQNVTCNLRRWNNESNDIYKNEVRSSIYELELQNRAMENDLTLRITNSKVFI